MRNPAKTPPVFDPRTIDPNRVPTGLKVLIAASFMIAVGFWFGGAGAAKLCAEF